MENDEAIYRSIEIPINKVKLIKQEWLKIFTPIVEYGKLQIRYNVGNRNIELRTCEETEDHTFLERSISFIQAILDGFKVEDATAIMKFRDVFTDSFELNEIRKLKSSHLSRALGRIIGRDGRTKQNIETLSKCKFIVVNQRIVFLGCDENIKIAKDAVGRLVQGSEPTSVFNKLRIISNKLKDKYGNIQIVYENLKQS